MGQVVPIDVADMPLATGPHEPDRDDGLKFAAIIDESAFAERAARDQPAGAGRAPDSVAMAPWVMYQPGNCQEVIPVVWLEIGSSFSGGGA